MQLVETRTGGGRVQGGQDKLACAFWLRYEISLSYTNMLGIIMSSLMIYLHLCLSALLYGQSQWQQ